MGSVYFDGEEHEVSFRDSQRQKVYYAERDWRPFGSRGKKAQLRHMSQEFIQLLVDGITESEFWLKLVNRGRRQPRKKWIRRVKVELTGRETGWAWGGVDITLPNWAKNIYTILHELAHVAAPNGAKHHWIFCQVHIALVREYIGAKAADELAKCYRARKVRIKPKRKVTEAQREAGRRLAASRGLRAVRPDAATFNPKGSRGTRCITCRREEFPEYLWKVGKVNYKECADCGHQYKSEDANLPGLRRLL